MWGEDEEEAAVPAANPNLRLKMDLGPSRAQPLAPSNHTSPGSGRLGGLNRFGALHLSAPVLHVLPCSACYCMLPMARSIYPGDLSLATRCL